MTAARRCGYARKGGTAHEAAASGEAEKRGDEGRGDDRQLAPVPVWSRGGLRAGLAANGRAPAGRCRRAAAGRSSPESWRAAPRGQHRPGWDPMARGGARPAGTVGVEARHGGAEASDLGAAGPGERGPARGGVRATRVAGEGSDARAAWRADRGGSRLRPGGRRKTGDRLCRASRRDNWRS